MPLLVDVTIYVSLANLDEFWKGLRISYDRVIEEKECTLFEVSYLEDKEKNEAVIHLVEGWSCTQEWFEEIQIKKPYYDVYLAATRHLWTRERVIEYYKRVPELTHIKDTHTTNQPDVDV